MHMIEPFWRNTPLCTKEEYLLCELMDAHKSATRRDNISSMAVISAHQGNGGNFNSSVISALATLGGRHAPVVETYDVLTKFMEDDSHDGLQGIFFDYLGKIPGWGNSFVKGNPDPMLDRIDSQLCVSNLNLWGLIWTITEDYMKRKVFPNMACYTAATAITIGMPREISPVLFHYGRLMPWAQLCYESTRQTSQENIRDNGERVQQPSTETKGSMCDLRSPTKE